MDYSVGNLNGHNSNPDNRSAKLLNRWPELTAKFERMVQAGNGRTETARLAYAVLLIMKTAIRVGNEESAEGRVSINKWSPNFGQSVQTYGVTTLRNSHVVKCEAGLHLTFVGKKAVEQKLFTDNPTLKEYCPQGPADELWLGIEYPTLFAFVKRCVGDAFTPKDIRRAKVNKVFLELLSEVETVNKKTIRSLIEKTAEIIGHTKAVCKRSYLSPILLAAIGG